MWEIIISTNKGHASSIDYIFNTLQEDVVAASGIIIKQFSCGRAKVSIAVKKEDKEYVKARLADAISETIVDCYKYEFLLNNLKLPLSNEVTKKALIKALTVFDKKTDKELIEEELVLKKELYIDSFYHFCLGELKNRWKDITDLISDNVNGLMLTDTFLDLLKFLIKTTEAEREEVYVTLGSGKIDILDDAMKSVLKENLMEDDVNIDVKVINELISLSPRKIILDESVKGRQTLLDFLLCIFEEKVEVR